MKPVASILRSKADQVIHTIAPSATMREALEAMAYHDTGALLVVDEGQVVGIFTERDYARKGALMGRDSRETPVSALMTTPVMYVNPQESNENCMALMTEHRVRHLAVIDEGKLVGVLSMRDLVRDIISEQQFVIEQLQHYISGSNG